MNILLLGPHDELVEYLESFGDSVVQSESRPEDLPYTDADFVVSYGYRHILPDWFISLFGDRIINMHISYLPCNRGADPNLWSWIEQTPKGVSIHLIDKGLDTGPIIAQAQADDIFDVDTDTLATSYAKLSEFAESFFKNAWPIIRERRTYISQLYYKGSYHCLSDRAKVSHLLTAGWDTPVRELIKDG